MPRQTLLILPMLLSGCQIMLDGGRANIIPLPETTDRMGERPFTSDDVGSHVATLGEKWGSMNLPYGNSATVVSSEDGRLVLSYRSNKLEGTATSFDSYFRANGWTRTAAHSEGNTRAIRFREEGHEMGILVEWTAPDDLKVTLEDFALVSESQVMSAFPAPAAAEPAAH